MVDRNPPLRDAATAPPPWLAPAAADLDQAMVRQWREAVDTRHRTAIRWVDEAFETPADPDLAAGISVVVVAGGEPAELDRCLRSLAEQTIGRDRFEVIVVLRGRRDHAGGAVERLRQASIRVRVARLDQFGGALDAGIAAASREYLTLVDGRDALSPSFLEDLVALVAPGVVPVARMIELPAGGGEPGQVPTGPGASRVRLADLGPAAAMPWGKLIGIRLARTITHHRGLVGKEDLVFWATAAVERRVVFRFGPGSASYHRSGRSEPVPEPVTSLDHAVRYLDLIAELERLARSAADPEDRDLLRRPIEEAAELIGDYLRRDPTDHPGMVEALDRRPIFSFPYQRMNRGLSRGLVIAYAFPPYADTSGTVMAKRIRTRGEVADVVYNTMDRIRKKDQTTRRISGPYTCDEAAIATPTHFSHWPSMEKFTLAGMRRIQDWTSAKGQYQWIYSRAHFAASHVLAATYKVSHPGVQWTAEFSDPLSRGRMDEELGTPVTEGPVTGQLRAGLRQLGLPVPASTNCFVWCEQVAYALADELIFTNENQLEYMLGYCSDPALAALARKKAVVSPHPTLPEEFYTMASPYYPLEDREAHLAYFGVFYATRGLDDVLTAVAESDPSIQARLRVHVFTSQPAPLRRRAAELGIADLVRVGGYVDYLAFLNLTTRFDCLVVNDTATRGYHARNPYLPSKWSDYQGSGTPVWGLVEPGSPLSQRPLAYRSPVGDIAAAKEVLSRIVRSEAAEQPAATG